MESAVQIRSALEGAHRMEKIRQDEAQAHLVLLLIGPHNPQWAESWNIN